MTIQRITIVGTGLIGASTGLALRAAQFPGEIVGWDRSPSHLQIALGSRSDRCSRRRSNQRGSLERPGAAERAGLHHSGLDGEARSAAPAASAGHRRGQCQSGHCRARAATLRRPGPSRLSPRAPHGRQRSKRRRHADAELFSHAVWLFTEFAGHPLAAEWRSWVERFGCRTMDIQARRHDEICAWVSHLPQYLSTALSAMLEDRFGDAPDLRAIGGRALREMTRLGASPYSMWRDVAHTNTEAVAEALLALEQRLAHLRENLKTPELRDEFELANRFRTNPP